MFTVMLSVNAQVATENAKFLDNTYITINAGATTPLTFNKVFPVNPTAGVAVGKWFTPVFGAEVEGTAWFGSAVDGGLRANMGPNGGFNLVRGTYVGVNGLMNLTNLFKGYQGTPRTFEIGLDAGAGWIHGYTPKVSDKYNNALGAKTGLTFDYNFGQSKAHTLSLRPSVYWNLSNPGNTVGQLAFNNKGAQLSVGVAYTYHFKTSNGTRHFKTYDVGAMMAEVDRLNAELAKKPKEVVREVVREVSPRPNTNAVRAMPTRTVYVFFAQCSAELTDVAKAELDKVQGTVDITATASPEGTAEFNQELSEKRANVVAEYLKSKNVTVNSQKGLGVTGDDSNRVAIVTVTGIPMIGGPRQGQMR